MFLIGLSVTDLATTQTEWCVDGLLSDISTFKNLKIMATVLLAHTLPQSEIAGYFFEPVCYYDTDKNIPNTYVLLNPFMDEKEVQEVFDSVLPIEGQYKRRYLTGVSAKMAGENEFGELVKRFIASKYGELSCIYEELSLEDNDEGGKGGKYSSDMATKKVRYSYFSSILGEIKEAEHVEHYRINMMRPFEIPTYSAYARIDKYVEKIKKGGEFLLPFFI